MNRLIVPLIVGVDGFIGNALWSFFRDKIPQTYGTSRKRTDGLPFLDLCHPDLTSLNIDFRQFTHVIIAAGMPNIRQCEINPVFTRTCNLTGPLQLAEQCLEKGLKPVLFSTDYVFDGVRGGYSETDALNPLNEYGRQKAELERKIPEICSNTYLMIRLTKVFELNVKTGLLGEIAYRLLQKQPICSATDQIFSPIFLDDVVHGISRLMDLDVNGLYNLGGPEIWSRYDLALETSRALQANSDLIQPILLEDLNEAFKRPKKTDLLSHKFEKHTGLNIRNPSRLIVDFFRRSYTTSSSSKDSNESIS